MNKGKLSSGTPFLPESFSIDASTQSSNYVKCTHYSNFGCVVFRKFTFFYVLFSLDAFILKEIGIPYFRDLASRPGVGIL